MDLSSLAEALPVSVQTGNDLVFGDIISGQKSTLLWETTADINKRFTLVKEIQMTAEAAGAGWTNPGFEDYGLSGFNEVKLNPESRQILTIQGRPLLVTGRFGQGRTVAFTGFTPCFTPEVDWMYDKSRYEYFVDQEFVTNPVTKAYFSVFMQMVAAAVGEKSAANYREVLAARDKPLFETLQDLPQATLKTPGSLKARIKNGEATATLALTNDAHYARLVRLRDEWKAGQATTPYLVLYSDNYFDLAPEESRTVELHFFLPEGAQGEVTGELVIEGANVKSTQIGVIVAKGADEP